MTENKEDYRFRLGPLSAFVFVLFPWAVGWLVILSSMVKMIVSIFGG